MNEYYRVDASTELDALTYGGRQIQYLARLDDYDDYGSEFVLCKLIVDGREVNTDSVADMKAALDVEYFDAVMHDIHRMHVNAIRRERSRRVEPLISEVTRFASAWTKPVIPRDPGFRFSDEAKPHVVMLMDLALSEAGNESDAADPKEWGPCHLAANRVSAWIESTCGFGGGWVWTALLDACGVDVGRLIAEHN